MRILIILGLCALASQTTFAQYLYSRTGMQQGIYIRAGSDIQAVINAAPAGSVFTLGAGMHRLTAPLTARSNDTFVGEKNRGIDRLTIVSGGRLLTNPQTTTVGGNTVWYYTGQTQQGVVQGGTAGPPDQVCIDAYLRCREPEDVFFNNIMKKHETALSAVGPGTWFFDYAADIIYVGDNPTGQTVETSVVPTMFNANTASGVTVRSMIIEKFASPTATGAINLGSSASGGYYWLADDVESRFNHAAGFYTDTLSRVRNSYTHHNCMYGVGGSGAGIVVDGNEVAYNNVMGGTTNVPCGYNPYYGTGGSKWTYTNNLIVRGNYSHHNTGVGFWTDINNKDCLYEKNLIELNTRPGIFHEISYECTIRYNWINGNGTSFDYTFWTTSAGIEVVSSRNTEVYGNILIDNLQSITGMQDHRALGAEANDGPWELRNYNVHNNFVTVLTAIPGVGRTGMAAAIPGVEWIFDPADGNNHFEFNYYTLGALNQYFTWQTGDLNECNWVLLGNDEGGTFTRPGGAVC